MIPSFAVKIGLTPKSTNIGALKIESSSLETYGKVSAEFLPQKCHRRVWCFEETFLLADTNTEVVLKMLFLFFSNIDFQCNVKKFNWRSWTIAEALPTAWQVKLINKNKFLRTTIDENSELFVINIAALINLKLALQASQASLLAVL